MILLPKKYGCWLKLFFLLAWPFPRGLWSFSKPLIFICRKLDLACLCIESVSISEPTLRRRRESFPPQSRNHFQLRAGNDSTSELEMILALSWKQFQYIEFCLIYSSSHNWDYTRRDSCRWTLSSFLFEKNIPRLKSKLRRNGWAWIWTRDLLCQNRRLSRLSYLETWLKVAKGFRYLYYKVPKSKKIYGWRRQSPLSKVTRLIRLFINLAYLWSIYVTNRNFQNKYGHMLMRDQPTLRLRLLAINRFF